jgi:RHS repeat-associated protein
MEDHPTLFTQAGNFLSALSGGVDPRMGLYSAVLSIAQLNGNRGMGPSFPVIFRYTPLDPRNLGYGNGFSLGLSSYDRRSGELRLSSGERYHVVEQTTGTGITVLQKKLDNFRFEKDAANNCYRLTHRTGDVEILQGPATGFDIKMPTRLLSPAGHSLNLRWDAQNRLVSVADDQADLLAVSYPDSTSAEARLQLYPGQTEGYDVVLAFRNDKLVTISNLALPEQPLIWTLEYQAMVPDVWGEWLTGVTGPLGAREAVSYSLGEEGHKFPDEARRPAMPAVRSYSHFPGGGQPVRTVHYAYTDFNFLGYQSGNSHWLSNEDNLYDSLTDYIYGSVETHSGGNQQHTIRRSYNSFHLLISEEVSHGKTKQTTQTEYYAIPGKAFADQPPQYQLPKRQRVIWEDDKRKRVEISENTFDTSGNPLTRLTPDGKLTRWEYYAALGAGADCPAEPNGFTRFVKSVTVKPATTAYQDVASDSTLYRYSTCLAVPDTVRSLVLKTEERHYGVTTLPGGRTESTLLSTHAIDYEATDPRSAGQIVRCLSRHYPNGETSEAYLTTEMFSRTDTGAGTVLHRHTLIADDKLSRNYEHEFSGYSGRLLRSADAHGNNETYEYDGLGRQTRIIRLPDTEYENVWHYCYTLDPAADLPYCVTRTDPLRNKRRDWQDGTGRWIKSETRASDSLIWTLEKQRNYDGLGRPAAEMAADWRQPRTAPEADFSLKRTLHYDEWQQNNRTDYSDGTAELTVFDPISRQSTVAISGGDVQTGFKVTRYDQGGRPVQVSLMQADGITEYNRQTSEYDGLGRLRKETDALGNRTLFAYDLWGRRTETVLADNTSIVWHYAKSSSGALIAEITVNGTSLATQSFDGLGRLLSRTSGGQNWQYSYELPADTQATTERAPDGVLRKYTFLRPLGEVLTAVSTQDIAQRFRYNPLTHKLEEAQEGENSLRYSFYDSGQLKSSTATVSAAQQRQQSQLCSVAGQPQTITDWSGETQTWKRDASGWVTTLCDSMVSTELRYDSAKRIIGWRTTSLASLHWLDTTLTLDDFGREVERVIRDSRNDPFTLTREWSRNSQLLAAKTKKGATVLRDEAYQYDNRNRLVFYRCTGKELPEDRYGGLTEQQFFYDAFNNVIRRDTTYADGSVNQTKLLYEHALDRCQLTAVTNSHPHFPQRRTILRDQAGRVTADDEGRQFSYDALGRLRSLTAPGANVVYHYDAHNRIVTRQSPSHTPETSYYLDGRLNILERGTECTRLISADRQLVAQSGPDAKADIWLAGTDAAGSVLIAANGAGSSLNAYTAYGECSGAGPLLTGFKAEPWDPAIRLYALGNGYRLYNPQLMQFLSPDWLSPFGAGGINPYAYCAGDPVNRTDPGGSFSLSLVKWLGLGTSLLFLVAAVEPLGVAILTAGLTMRVMTAAFGTNILDLAIGIGGITGDLVNLTSTVASGFNAQSRVTEILGIVGWVVGGGATAFRYLRSHGDKIERIRREADQLKEELELEKGKITALTEANLTLQREVAAFRFRDRASTFPTTGRPRLNRAVQTETMESVLSHPLRIEGSPLPASRLTRSRSLAAESDDAPPASPVLRPRVPTGSLSDIYGGPHSQISDRDLNGLYGSFPDLDQHF